MVFLLQIIKLKDNLRFIEMLTAKMVWNPLILKTLKRFKTLSYKMKLNFKIIIVLEFNLKNKYLNINGEHINK